MSCYLKIDGRRDAYTARDVIGKTITVVELMDVLGQFGEDTPVLLDNDNCYTFGEISSLRIDLVDIEED